MQGFTIYLNEFNNLQYATKEQIGNMFLMAMDACENEIIPSFDNPMDAMLFDGFKRCLEKGFVRKKNGKNGGAPIGNQNAKKIKPNEGFDTTVSCYTPTQIVETRSMDTLNQSKVDSIIEEEKDTISQIIYEHNTFNEGKANELLHKMFIKHGYSKDCADTNKIIEYINNAIDNQE